MKAGYATNEAKFESIMQIIKEAEINLLRGVDPTDRRIARYMPYTYLISEDLDKWTQSHDGGRRYGAMTTNISECFNGVLKGARGLPIAAISLPGTQRSPSKPTVLMMFLTPSSTIGGCLENSELRLRQVMDPGSCT